MESLALEPELMARTLFGRSGRRLVDGHVCSHTQITQFSMQEDTAAATRLPTILAGLCAVGTASSSYAASAELGPTWCGTAGQASAGSARETLILIERRRSALTERRRKISDRLPALVTPRVPTCPQVVSSSGHRPGTSGHVPENIPGVVPPR